jgi:ferritin-like metal-binding protein YciE
MKKNNQGWEQILFYDIRQLEAIEEELKHHLPELIIKTKSLRLTLIMQKYIIFTEESLIKLGGLVKEGGIGVLLQPNTMATLFCRDTKEKINYCDNENEIDHCLIASLISIATLKANYYQQATRLSDKLGHPTMKNILQKMVEKEQRVIGWLQEMQEKEQIEQEELLSNGVAPRQTYWLL